MSLEEGEKEAIRAAAVQELEQLTSSFPTEEPAEYGRYTNAWNEETWEKDFDSHPLFMTKPPEDPANLPPLVEAMRQLKYDPEYNTALELADRYKREGNENFRLKKYRWAIDNYTAGIKQKADDDELNSMLYGNRAASHMRLGNNRSALSDSQESVRLDDKNVKSVARIAECYFNLKDYRSCVEYCQRHVLQHQPLEGCLKRAQKLLAIAEEEAHKQRANGEAEALHRQTLMQVVIQDRKVDLRGDLFHSHHPASADRHVELSEEGHLMWPVIFVYPEVAQSDFIEYFDEEATFRQQLHFLFGDESQRPAWDHDRKYQPDRLRMAFPRHDDPSQMVPVDACIKPLEKAPPDGRSKRERIQVSLTDCLACSGCVTSAETVLISQQSHEEFFNLLSQKGGRTLSGESDSSESYLTVVVTLSHQIIASFAVRYEIQFQDAADRLASFLKSLGVDYVFDLTLARHLALIEAGREFTDVWSKREDGSPGEKKLPILSTVCPGWVCYAEKTHGNLVPLLSRVKSPQQIMGSLVKDVWRQEKGIQGRIHHVTIMPCFDKKLEASRSNFMSPETREKDVDSVLTPIEVQQILDARGIWFPGIPILPQSMDVVHALSHTCVGGGGDEKEKNNDSSILSHFGSGSGGHAENVLVYAAQRLLHRESLSHTDLVYETRRNADFLEILVSDQTGERKLLFAIVNGFRNIQTLVQKVKRGKCEYDFVEVMACPSGCLNGGAQLKPDNGDVGGSGSGDSFSDRIKGVYRSLREINLPLDSSADPVKQLYDHWFPTPEIRERIFYTDFKAVPKTENLLTMTW